MLIDPPPESQCLQAALGYAARGWPVFPVHSVTAGRCSCGNKLCKDPGKHPHTLHGFKDASADAGVIRSWWQQWPAASVAICTGPESGLFVLDLDGADGRAVLDGLLERHGPLPDTPRARSGGGGWHYFFAWPAGRKIGCRIKINKLPIDVRGAGGYIVAAPSSHRSGYCYSWEVSPEQAPLAEAPVWLLDFVAPPPPPPPPQSLFSGYAGSARGSAWDRAVQYVAHCPPAVSGQGGHSTTMGVARAVVFGFDLGPERGFDLLWQHYNQRCEPPWSEKELRHKCDDATKEPFEKPRGYLLNESLPAAPPRAARPAAAPPLPDYVPFPVHLLPEVVAQFVTATAEAVTADPAFVALPALAAVGAAIGTTHAAAPKRRWHIFPCIWALTVGRSGSGKSPGFTAVNAVVQELEAVIKRTSDEQTMAYNNALAARKKDDETPAPPRPPELRFRLGDVTIEQLAGILADNPRGLVVMVDELSAWFGGFTRYKAGRGDTDRPRWLSIFDIGAIDYDRKTGHPRSIRLWQVLVGVTGGIQPAVLQEAMTPEAVGAGLFARILVAYPPDRLVTWTDAEADEETVKRFEKLLKDLWDLPHDFADGRRRPFLIRLSAEGRDIFRRFFDANRYRAFMADNDGAAATLVKLESYALRFALIRHVCRHRELSKARELSAEDVAAGVALAEWFGDEAVRLAALFAEPQEMAQARRVDVRFRLLAQKTGDGLTPRHVQRSNGKQYRTTDAAREALEALVAAGLWRFDGRIYYPVRQSDTSDSAAGEDEQPSDTAPE